MGIIGRGRNEPVDLTEHRRDGVLFADGAQVEIAPARVRRQHWPVVGRKNGDGRGSSPGIQAGEGGTGAVRHGSRSATIDQGVGQRSRTRNGGGECRVRKGDGLDQGLDRGRGQGAVGHRGEGDLQGVAVRAVVRRVHRADLDIGKADGTARYTDLPGPGTLMQHAQLVTRIAARGIGDAQGSPPEIEPVVSQIIVDHRNRAVDPYRGPSRGVGLGVVETAAEASDHRGVIDGSDVHCESAGRLGHAAGVGNRVGKGGAAPVARRLRGVVTVPDLVILDVLQGEHTAYAQLPDDRPGARVALVKIADRRRGGNAELDLGAGAVGINRRHDVSAIRGVGRTQESSGDLQGAPLRHTARTVVDQLGRLVGGQQLDRNGGGGAGGAVAVRHRVLERVLGRGPVGVGEDLDIARVDIAQPAIGQFGLGESGVHRQIAPGRGRLAIGLLQLAVGGQRGDGEGEGGGRRVRI